jgi:peptide/nickel transport system permease protein
MNSFLICGTSMIAAWMMAIPLAILSMMRRGKWIYHGVILLGMPMLAMPGYYFAGLLLWFLDHFVDPMMSRAQLWGIYGWQYEGLPMSWGKFLSCLAHLAPIWFIVGMPVFVVAFRVLRASLKETLELPFITVARSKGLPLGRVYFKHAVRYSLNPLISTIGVTLPTVLVNALLVGFVFGIPTYGDLLKNAIEYQDAALLAPVMVFYSFVLVVGSLVTDLGLAMADPRIRYR